MPNGMRKRRTPQVSHRRVAPSSKFLGDRARPRFVESLRAAVFLGAVFGLGYGFTNWLSSHRDAYVAWHHECERQIPYCWWMIAPYVSMNALFSLAPFVCRNRRELRLLVRRTTLTIIAAAIVFLLWPSQLNWTRPAADSLPQAALQSLIDLDEPYNAFPSLHVALVLPMARAFRPVRRGIWKELIRCWFVLIAASTVLTYQHHLLDSTAGLVLGLLCRRLVVAETATIPIAELWRSWRERWTLRSAQWRERAATAFIRSFEI
jgi:membrane-associated phospholipid phosphatase